MRKKRRARLEMRTAQKQSMRYVYAASSVFAIAAVMFIYINFSNNSESLADDTTDHSYKATYTTTDLIVPSRLLLKPHPGIRRATEDFNPKADSAYRSVRIGRSIQIETGRYITE